MIGALAFLALSAASAVLLVRRQRKKSEYAASEPPPDPAVMAGPVHNAPPTPGAGAKFYSPEAVGTSGSNSHSHSNAGSSVPIVGDRQQASSQGSSSRGASARPAGVDAELDGDAPQIYQLHGVSKWPAENVEEKEGARTGRGRRPVYHELAGTEVGAPRADDSDQVSTVGTLEGPDERVDASSDLVSPATPVHPGTRAWRDSGRKGSSA